jgi:hypothetical protein
VVNLKGEKVMTRDEFITACSKSGYCDKETAELYAGDRKEFTEKDFENVYRYAEKIDDSNDDRWRSMWNGVKTTKRYKTTGW